MSVTSWDEQEGARRAVKTANTVTVTRVYKVITSAFTDTEYDVLTYSSAPAIGDTYPDNSFLRVKSVRAQQAAATPSLWMVTVEYSTSVPENKDEVFADPTDRPPKVSIRGIRQSYPAKVIPDYFNRIGGGNIVMENSAGVPYDPPVMRESTDMAIVVVQNFRSFHPKQLVGYPGAVNSEVWETFDKGQCRIVSLDYDRVTENGRTFWHRTIEIHVREKTDDYSWDSIYPWQELRENVGIQQLDTNGEYVEPIYSSDGLQLFEQVHLDGDGRYIKYNVDPTFKRLDLYPKKNFADLSIRLQ